MLKNYVLTGLALGDALGHPFEFQDYYKISSWDGQMSGIVPGSWTDDTKMARALAESLVEEKNFNYQRVAEKYIAWVQSGDLRGIGEATARAMGRMLSGTPPLLAGTASSRSSALFRRVSTSEDKLESKVEVLPPRLTGTGDFCGNGTVMRAAPLGVFYRSQSETLREAAITDAVMTHDHADAKDASWALCSVIASLLNDPNKNLIRSLLKDFAWVGEHVSQHLKTCFQLIDSPLPLGGIEDTWRSNIDRLGARGTAHETLASALYCFLAMDNPRDIMVNAVKMGGDTDTRAAVAGALCGAYYPLTDFPSEWLEILEDRDQLMKLDEKIWELGAK